ncbi:VOC family protein [Alkalihalobacillus sp. MEB130]|uniref:VOC family protein n=1 Tax=Alkalihalobacillus sp. MEB130 TaxID=2976704 RepID=UPI0028DF9D99|nr:VOC family protein [Alkalihalobacillus sp. MEB130]MDT8863049.1 VOC family protein [Alkalihalobacillus sp. MEB130]
MKLTHTRLLVNNYEACFHFYKNVLSFECTWGTEHSNYAQFQVGGTQLAIFDKKQMLEDLKESNDSALDQPLHEVALIFAVENVDEVYHSLKSKVHFVTEPHDREDWGIRVAHFRDPNGTLLEINTNIPMSR